MTPEDLVHVLALVADLTAEDRATLLHRLEALLAQGVLDPDALAQVPGDAAAISALLFPERGTF